MIIFTRPVISVASVTYMHNSLEVFMHVKL